MSVDNLIDRVARGMTAEPAPDLSARVGDRIADLPQSRAWRWTLVPIAGFAAATVVLAAVILGPNPGIPESPNPRIPESPNPRIPESENPRILESQNPRIPESPNPRIPVSSSAAEWQARAVPALPAVEPLVIDRIQPIPLSIPLLQVEPLVVPAIGDDK